MEVVGEFSGGWGAAPLLTEFVGGGGHVTGQFLGATRYPHPPGGVAEVAFEGADLGQVAEEFAASGVAARLC
jgi:hypothetical protein